jgi:hypothetical protein
VKESLKETRRCSGRREGSGEFARIELRGEIIFVVMRWWRIDEG